MIHLTYSISGVEHTCCFRTRKFTEKWWRWALRPRGAVFVGIEVK